MKAEYTKRQLRDLLIRQLDKSFDTTPKEASDKQFYRALAMVVCDLLEKKQKAFQTHAVSEGRKQVYYLSMEFLMGRSLKTNLYNLSLAESAREVLEEFDVSLDNLFELEPDAGLGNGGLGRLAACYLDSLATLGLPATGHSILYEYGIFKQKIVDGWQTELPDDWLPGGDVWLRPAPEPAVDVRFGGEVEEIWDNGYHLIRQKNYTTVRAVPYDMYVSGFDSEGVSLLRLWKAECPAFDMESFNRGDYTSALRQSSEAEAISKVLYPNDNHVEGKMLRLRQQYFLCAAAVGSIVGRHMQNYGTLDNLAEHVAIHINDTHPTLAIPELMRILLDECGYTWDAAWSVVGKVFAYTNHTVMSEALEKWNEDLFKGLLPRIYQIVHEINERYCAALYNDLNGDLDRIARMAVIADHQIKMANLCVAACHSVNGVSKLHSEIIKDQVFHDFYLHRPEKFTNVTNGIAYRRWLYQSNPHLTALLEEVIGDGFLQDAGKLIKLRDYAEDESVLRRLGEVKRRNKLDFCAHIQKTTGIAPNPDSIFDVQVKRLHEYKRQHLNALHIIAQYQYLLAHPDADFTPKTYIFGAKAAPGYYLAKQIIKLLCSLGEEIDRNPAVRDKLRVIYLEDYNVTMSERLTPASELSEQISLAGTEASGTGNMKLMLGGAVTIGTEDGANIEIGDAAGRENIITFGLHSEEVDALCKKGYSPERVYENNPVVQSAIDLLYKGIDGRQFDDVANSLRFSDPYLVLADFDDYCRAQEKASALYRDPIRWNRMSLHNIAAAGAFSADRAILEYADRIWAL